MNRIDIKFEEIRKENRAAFVPFVSAGDPDFDTSKSIIKTLIENGADMLELGMPFSDPIADGPTIQGANERALENGMNVNRLFEIIREIRSYSDIPVCLMVYYNLILQRGTEKFYGDAVKAGADGMLAVDLPLEEAGYVLEIAEKNRIHQIFMIAPTTTDKRLSKILIKSKGYLYLVSLLGVTGAREGLQKDIFELIKRVKQSTKLPVCVGFGISKPEHVKEIKSAGADGVIIGSAIVRIIEQNLSDKKIMLEEIKKYVVEMKKSAEKEDYETFK